MALPFKKRDFSGAYSLSNKRMRRIERQVYRNRPEMKSNTLSFNANTATGGTQVTDGAMSVIQPCAIGTGTGVDDRIGDKIRLYRIEVRGVSDQRLDWYIIQKKTTTDPTIASFTSQMGAYLLDSLNTNQFTEWSRWRGSSGGDASHGKLQMSKKFKGGIVIKYNAAASTAAVDNEIVVAVVNQSGASRASNVTVRIWYTDA